MRVHQGLEKRLVTHVKKITTVDDYIQLLELMYGFYAPLHEKLQAFTKQEQRHAGNILDDIKYFTGSQAEEMPVHVNLPEINSLPAALGVLYVTEGSTLGGVIIAGMISKKLNLPVDKGFSFFNAYGGETQHKWKKFKEMLNGPFTPAEHEEIKKAAISAFSTFNEWISEYESASHKQI